MSAETIIDKIDKGLANYYNVQGRTDYFDADGKGKFRVFCDENGFEPTDIKEEMENTDANDCLLPEFDSNFPGLKKTDLTKILSIIKKCADHGANVSFGRTKSYTSDMFQLSQQEKTEIKKLYRRQCTREFLSPMEKDDAFYDAMMFGQKMNEPYISHLVDNYMRWRVRHHLKGKSPKQLTVTAWAQNHPHFRMLRSINSQIKEEVLSAVKNCARICPKLEFQPVALIQGSLRKAVDVIHVAINFVHKYSKEEGCCPFQMDVCIGYDPFKDMIGDEKDDDDDDDDDDEDADYQSPLGGKHGPKGYTVDIIGDVLKKLDTNKLIHHSEKDLRRYNFNKAYQGFADKAQYNKQSPQNKRWIAFVDERVKRNEDEKDERETLMFAPPSDCDTIPANAVNEWFFASTATCLIPNMEYKLQEMMDKDMNAKNDNKNQKEKLENSDITSKMSGSVMTLSFHVKEEERISCYLYVMGQYMRFMPRDVIDILPDLFDKSTEDNAEFVKELKDRVKFVKELHAKNENEIEMDLIQEMEMKLIDRDFETFCTTYPID